MKEGSPVGLLAAKLAVPPLEARFSSSLAAGQWESGPLGTPKAAEVRVALKCRAACRHGRIINSRCTVHTLAVLQRRRARQLSVSPQVTRFIGDVFKKSGLW